MRGDFQVSTGTANDFFWGLNAGQVLDEAKSAESLSDFSPAGGYSKMSMKSYLTCFLLGIALFAVAGCATHQRISVHSAQSGPTLEQARPLTYVLELKTDDDPAINRSGAENCVRRALRLRGFEESNAGRAHLNVAVSCEVDHDDTAQKVERDVALISTPNGGRKETSSVELKRVKERVVARRSRQVVRVVVRDLRQKPTAVLWQVKVHSELPDSMGHNELIPGLVWAAVGELGRPKGSHQVVIDADDLKPLTQPTR